MPATIHHAHTRGPFSLVEEDGDLLIVAPDLKIPEFYGLVAQVLDCDFPANTLANGYLLSASADLLAALKVLLERHQIDEPHHADRCEFCKMANAAIAKAEATV